MRTFIRLGYICILSALVLSCTAKKEVPKETPVVLEDWRMWNVKLKDFKPGIGICGGELVVTSFGSEVKTFNPITSNEASSSEVLQFIFEGLTGQDIKTLDPVPALAESWTVSEDNLTYDFNLRKDILWPDGQPFTADDVLFTFEVVYDKRNISAFRDILLINGKQIRVTKTSPYSVRMRLPCPCAPFLKIIAGMGLPIVPRHKLAEAQRKGRFVSTWEISTDVAEIVGAGPFMIDLYEPSQRIVLKRNPHYWKKDTAGTALPYLEKIVFLYVKDQSAELLKFKNGESDYYEMRCEDYPILKPLEKGHNFTIYNLGPRFGEQHLLFNQNPETSRVTGKPFVLPYRSKWFRNKRFRQAVAYCIDKEEMIRIVHNGLARPQWSPMNEASGYFSNPDVKKYPFNPDSARAILAQEGFTDKNGDGKLEDGDGNPVEFTMVTNAGNSDRKKYGEIIRKDLERVGITVHFSLLEFNNLIDKLESTFDWEAMILGMTGGDEPHTGSNVWLSGGRTHEWYPKQKTPSTPWEARIDTIFMLGAQEMDREKRKALYDEWQDIFAEQLPFIELITPLRLAAVRNTFGNTAPAPAGDAIYSYKRKFFHNIEEIYVVPAKR